VHIALDRRFRKRVPCRLSVPSGSYSGMVLNVSRGGLFVQTSAGASPGDAVHLDLAVDEAQPVPVDARVVWRRVVASHLRTVSTGGIGVHIQYASDAYFGFVACLAAAPGSETEDAPRAPRASAKPAYRVHLRFAGSPRTRLVVVEAADEAEARERARAVAGAQWVVLGLDQEARED
jgi:Tfp pilus assembly protein PilZ